MRYRIIAVRQLRNAVAGVHLADGNGVGQQAFSFHVGEIAEIPDAKVGVVLPTRSEASQTQQSPTMSVVSPDGPSGRFYASS